MRRGESKCDTKERVFLGAEKITFCFMLSLAPTYSNATRRRKRIKLPAIDTKTLNALPRMSFPTMGKTDPN